MNIYLYIETHTYACTYIHIHIQTHINTTTFMAWPLFLERVSTKTRVKRHYEDKFTFNHIYYIYIYIQLYIMYIQYI